MANKNKIAVGINKPFVLDNHAAFWMVTMGEVDVYYASVAEDGSYKSRLNYLYKACKGELIFGLLSSSLTSGIKLMATSSNAHLIELNKPDIIDIDHTFLEFHINKWITKLTNVLFTDNTPRIYKPLTDGAKVKLLKDEVAYPPRGVVWCTITNGNVSKYAGFVYNEVNSPHPLPFPVNANLWMKCLSDNASVTVENTAQILAKEELFLPALQTIQECFYQKLLDNEEKKTAAEQNRITSKLCTDDIKLDETVSELVSIVNTKKNTAKPHNNLVSGNNVLLDTCQVIGSKTNIRFVCPKHQESSNGSYNKQLFIIAQASNVRIRKVMLRGSWWKEENGHMLAFMGEEKHPVALIQKSSGLYTITDLKSNTVKPVTKEIADSLDPAAYMFFFSFNSKMNSIRKIWNFAIQGIKHDAKYLVLAALAGSLLGLLVPVLSGVMFDDVIPSADRSMLFQVFGILLIIGIVTALLQLIQGVLQLRVETKSNLNLQGGVMDHLLRLPVNFYRQYTAGDLTNRVLSINAIRQILSNTVITTVLSGAFSIVNLVLLFRYNVKLAWIGVGLSAIAVAFIAIVGWLKLKYDRQISNDQGEIQGFLFEFLSGITKIRITGSEKRIFSLWATRFSRLKKTAFTSGNYQNYIEVFNASYPLVTSIFFFSFIYYLMTNEAATTAGLISVGAFMAFITAFNQFLNDALRMSLSVISSLNVVTLYERVKPIFDETPESTDQSGDPGELNGEIELNSVSFKYNEDQPLVLNNISFKIKPGEMVAFVGPSGSGKSTVMRILLGFEKPESGSVYYNGTSFDAMNKDLVRQQIGVVLQNGALMSGSIYKNIVGNSDLSLEDAWSAARMAGMEEDIKSMPMGMHTVISEGAGTFSGGQRQRLMIARAIAHKPRLLYMDEATSALDNKTQKIVSDSLDNLQATRIVIAHRLSTIMNADRIYVMDKGTIVESGTYEELMKKSGLFSKLAKRQIA